MTTAAEGDNTRPTFAQDDWEDAIVDGTANLSDMLSALGANGISDVVELMPFDIEKRRQIAEGLSLLLHGLSPVDPETIPEVTSEEDVPAPVSDLTQHRLVHGKTSKPEVAIVSPENQDALNKNTRWLLEALLKVPPLPSDTQAASKLFIQKLLTDVYPSVRRDANQPRGRVAIEKRIREVLLFVDGHTHREIKNITDASSGMAVQQNLYMLPHLFYRRGYPPERLQAMFREFMEKVDTAHEAGTRAGLAEEPAMAETEQKPEAPDWKEALIEICSPYWHEEDLQSLQALLDDHKDEAKKFLARHHLVSLMAVFAPHQGDYGDSDILNRAEWDTINYLAGFRLQQGQKPVPVRFLPAKLAPVYERMHTKADDALLSGVGKLIKRAQPHYTDEGWYPNLTAPQASPTTSQGVKAEVPKPERAKEQESKLTQALEAALKGRAVSKAGMAQLQLHFGNHQSDVIPNSRDLNLALSLLGGSINDTIKNQRQLGRIDRDQKELLLPLEQQLLSYLRGDPNNGRYPRSYDELCKDSRMLGMLGIKPAQVRPLVISALQKVGRKAHA